MTRNTIWIRDTIRNRPPVREQAPMRGRELVVYLTLSALIALPAVFGLWQQNDFVRTSFEIEALRKEKLALQERYRRLRIERATLESLGRISREARRCGLVPRPEAGAPLHILPGGAAADAPIGETRPGRDGNRSRPPRPHGQARTRTYAPANGDSRSS